MTELFHRKWFKPAVCALYLLLQLGFLLLVLFRHTANLTQDTAFQLLLAPGNVTDNCIAQQKAPLYPLLVGVFCKWGIAVPYAVAIVNVALFAALCWILYRIALRYLKDVTLSVLPVALYGFSASAASAVSHAEPSLLCGVFAAVCFFISLRILEKRARLWDHLSICCTILLGFLTDYDFALFTLCLTAVCGVILLCQRAYSTATTLAVTAGGAILLALILFPACIEAIAGVYTAAPLPYAARLLGNITFLSARLFAGGIAFVALGLLVLLGICYFQPAKKPETASVVPAAPRPDPAEAAYQRRILRRTREIHTFRITLTKRGVFAGAVLAAGFLYTCALSALHKETVSAGLFLLEPILYVLTISAAYSLLSRVIKKQPFALLTAAGIFLCLNGLSLF